MIRVGNYSVILTRDLLKYSTDGENWTTAYEVFNDKTLFADDLTIKNDNVGYVWTGKEYIKKVKNDQSSDIYISYDMQNWSLIELPENALSNYKELKWFGDRYIMPAPYGSMQAFAGKFVPMHHYVLDENFNVIASMETWMYPISNLSYYNGHYYYSNIKGAYISDDFINWESLNEKILYPLSFDNNVVIGKRYSDDSKYLHCIYRDVQELHINDERIGVDDIQTGYDFYWYTDNNKFMLSVDGVYWAECITPMYVPKETSVEDTKILYVDRNSFYIEDSYYRIKFDISEVLEYLNNLKTVYVEFNNELLAFAEPPVLEEEYTLVPMRFLFEEMEAEVDWEDSTLTASVKKDNREVSFVINSKQAKVGNEVKTMDIPARLINGKTMIPLRFLSEELGYKVEWDDSTRTATISK